MADYIRKGDVFQPHSLKLKQEHFKSDNGLVCSLNILPGNTCLDLGCGLGADLQLAQALGAWAVGVDKHNYVNRPSGLNFLLLDASHPLPFADKFFDVALANGLFCQLTDDEVEKVINNMKRVAKRFAFTEVFETSDDYKFVRHYGS